MNTFRGEPLHWAEGWVVIIRSVSGYWFPLLWTVSPTRREAIDKLDENWFDDTYERRRRRGEAKAVRCEIRPMVFGEDR